MLFGVCTSVSLPHEPEEKLTFFYCYKIRVKMKFHLYREKFIVTY